MAIPRIIVQTHRSLDIGEKQRKSWQTYHPQFDYQFFNDEDCEKFIRDKFPRLWSTYSKLPLVVQKADLFRYAAIYHGGGIYADVDTQCLAPVNSYVDLSRPNLVVGVEMNIADWTKTVEQHTKSYCSPVQWLQWVFAAPPGHPGLGMVLRRIQLAVDACTPEQLEKWSATTRFTLELTGPMMFSQVLWQLIPQGKSAALTVLPRQVWGALPEEFSDPDVRRQMKVAHLFAGSWKPEWIEARAQRKTQPPIAENPL